MDLKFFGFSLDLSNTSHSKLLLIYWSLYPTSFTSSDLDRFLDNNFIL